MERLPNDIEIERIVLGTIISNRYGYDDVRDIIHIDCFYDEFHRNVFTVFKEIESRGGEPDSISIGTEYRSKYNDIKLLEIVSLNELSEVSQVYKHTLRLIDLSARRKVIKLAYYMQNKAINDREDISDIANHATENLSNIFSISDNPISTIKDAVNDVYAVIDNNKTNYRYLTGSPTGFNEIDKKSGGLQKGSFTVIAGETSQGKTSFAMSILNNTSKYGTKVAVYSLEMSKVELTARLMSMESGIPATELLYSPLEDYKFERLDKSISTLCNTGIYFDDRSTSNIDNILNSVRTMVAKYQIDGVIIDYLQILSVNIKGNDREQHMGDVSRRLKNIAKDLNIWVMALSQLNRSDNPEPNVGRLRSSGQIGEAADNIFFVYRPEVYKRSFPEPFEKYDTTDMAMIIGAKGRNIGLMSFLTSFNKRTTQFSDTNNILEIQSDEPF